MHHTKKYIIIDNKLYGESEVIWLTQVNCAGQN